LGNTGGWHCDECLPGFYGNPLSGQCKGIQSNLSEQFNGILVDSVFFDNLSTLSSLYANFCLLDSKLKSHTDLAKCLYKNLHGLVENETFW
jgi:hypothetical protein